MRPLRLVLDGFGSYRDRTDIALAGVDFFVLTGPTGSGKSTVIDALCFALYGTVPRWGKDNVIRNALAPSSSRCEVCVVFELAGARYVAVRQLRRDARGNVGTKEARLERLDPAVPPEADLADVLGATVEQIASGPDQVSAAVTRLLGITYEHFTQCVLLPQGKFAEFLQAKPGERQKLLVELLAYGVYDEVKVRAGERARDAGSRLSFAQERRTSLGEATGEAIGAARRRVAALGELEGRVAAAVEEITGQRAEAAALAGRATELRGLAGALAALRVPPGVPELAARLVAADELERRRAAESTRLDAAADEAERRCAGLLDRSVLAGWRDAHRRAAELDTQLEAGQQALRGAEAAEAAAAEQVQAAEQSTAGAAAVLAAAEQAHRAAALAADLRPGQPCPVCRQPVTTVPHHEAPADLAAARAAVDQARTAGARARAGHAADARRSASAQATVAQLEQRIAEVAAALAGAPPPAEVDTLLAERAAADSAFTGARAAAREARDALAAASRARDDLREAERRAWSALREARDGFAALRPPALDGTDSAGGPDGVDGPDGADLTAGRAADRTAGRAAGRTADRTAGLAADLAADLAAAWKALVAWAGEQRVEAAARGAELDTTSAALLARADGTARRLVAALGEHGVPVADAQHAPVELARHLERARGDLVDLRQRHEQGVELDAEIARLTAQRQVADRLSLVLRSDRFQRWLCAEALDSLMVEASETLMQLSGGQFELDRGERGEIVVIDHNDAGAQRHVSTLSGGETFQASLALALALSHQVVGLSGGRRPLGSMFLDEGFGTLDESTLDTVASTLERLAADSDRMVGIVTHVPALAERVPVQFAVARDGASSRIRRVQDVMVGS